MDLTRRGLARVIAATAVVPLKTAAQTPPDADQKMKSALNDIKLRAQRMNSVRVPAATEPAFVFKP